MKNHWLIKALIATFIFVFSIYILDHYLDWAKLLSKWQSVDAEVLAVALLLTMLSQALRGVRVFHAYRVQKLDVSFFSVMMVSLLHNAANFMFPMRLGELIFPALSRQSLSVPVAQSAKTLLGIRLFDLYTVVLLLLLLQYQRLEVLVGSALPILLLLALAAPAVLPSFKKLSWVFPPQYQSVPAIYTGLLLSVIIWSIKLWGLQYLLNTFLMPDVLSFEHAGSALLAADLSSVLPINGFASSGSYEVAFIIGLSKLNPYGVVAVQAVKDLWLYAIVNMHVFLIITNVFAVLLGGLCYMLPKLFNTSHTVDVGGQ